MISGITEYKSKLLNLEEEKLKLIEIMMDGVITTTESQNKARLAILDLAHMMSVPMSLVAVINLKVPEAIWQGGSNTPLSASQILARIRPHGGGDSKNLQRILRLLTSYNIFVEHLSSNGDRKYSLTDIGKTLVDDDQGLSFAYYMLQHHEDAWMRTWPLMEEAVKDPGTEPFEKANGEEAVTYYTKRPEMKNLFDKALYGMSVTFMRELLERYDGFHGVETLVDVGGNNGVCLRMIMHKYPTLRKGINYDLPHVIAYAPQIPGVINVGGDAVESVPCGDAILLKWVSTAWTDEESKQVWKNCYKALPVGGKLIVCEPVLPEVSDESQRTRTLLAADIFNMTMYSSKGKHRTEQQFKQLAVSAGFPHFRAFYVDAFLAVLEVRK